MTWCASTGSSTPTPNRPDVCTTIWPGCQLLVARQPGDELGQRVVGHGQQHQLGRRQDAGDIQDRYAGQQHLGPLPGRRAHGRRRDDPVAGPSQGRTEDGSHPTGPDDADVQPGRTTGRVVLRVVASVAREAVSICEMHGRNLSGPAGQRPAGRSRPETDGCPPERPSALDPSSTAASAPTITSSTRSSTAVHTSSTAASTGPDWVGANPLRHKGISQREPRRNIPEKLLANLLRASLKPG